jgi:DNA repair protein SbcD/Mre11
MKLLHFADAHIDMANYGRHDPETGLPLRMLDFLKSLDKIVNTAIDEKVDMVIFAGDAYKDRSPAPTFQREWGRRIIRLSQARIPTLLLVGNHDLSPAIGRAHAIQEFDTLQVPYVRVLSKIQFLGPKELWGLPLQVIALPWISRSAFMADYEIQNSEDLLSDVFNSLQDRIIQKINEFIDQADSSLPIILTAHASIEGAKFGGERLVMLGNDLVLSGSLVKNQKFSYVAMGHIHKPQDINHGYQPPVVYPGSIERVDFGEAHEDKFFVIAHIEKAIDTKIDWRKIEGTRAFIERRIILETNENVTETIISVLPKPKELEGAIIKLVVEYPRDFESLIDDAVIRKYTESAFEFHLVKRPQIDNAKRVRVPPGQTVSSLSPLELLDQYWRAAKVEDTDALQKLAQEILTEENENPGNSL